MRVRSAATLALALAFTAAAPAQASTDWQAVAAVDTIEVITRDADGSERVTTIWLVVVDGQPYIRTGSSSWFENVERDPNVALRIEGQDHPVRAELVPESDPTWERAQQAFRDKYGWSDRLLLPGMGTNILRAVPR
jgi:hypothetical protein